MAKQVLTFWPDIIHKDKPEKNLLEERWVSNRRNQINHSLALIFISIRTTVSINYCSSLKQKLTYKLPSLQIYTKQ